MAASGDRGDRDYDDRTIVALRDEEPGEPLPQDLTEDIYSLLRQLGVLTAPGHQAQAIQGMQQWLQQSRGSSAAILPQLLPQIRQLREQLGSAFTGISQRLGPAGGKQIAREKSAALGATGQQLSKMLTGMQQQGVTGLQGFLQGMRPALLTQLPQLTSATQEGPAGYDQLGKLISGLGGLAGQIWGPSSTAPSIDSLNPGYMPQISPNLSGINSGYGDFVTYGA